MVRHKLALSIAIAGILFGCAEKTVSIGNPPPAPTFTIDTTKIDANHPIFKVMSAVGFMVNWDFGNGTLTQDSLDTVYYPFADTYTVKLTASNKGGATTTSKKIVIATTDPKICLNKYYTFLAGGCGVGSKTWKFDSADGAMANGPPSSKDSLGNGTSNWNDVYEGTYWWHSKIAGIDVNDPPTPPKGALDDEYVFGLRGFTYKNDCHGDFYFNWMWANKLYGMTQAQYHDTVHSYMPNNPAKWTLDIDSTTPEQMTAKDSTTWKRRFFTDSATGKRFNLILTLSNNNYIGYCSGVNVFEILKINADTMYLRHELVDPSKPTLTGSNRTEWRYSRFVAKK